MKIQSKLMRIATAGSLAMLILVATFASAFAGADVQEKTIASTRAGDVLVTLTNESGKFTAGCESFLRPVPEPESVHRH